jgi:hypothetical protein
VLDGPRRGLPLSAEGLDEILDGGRRRTGLVSPVDYEPHESHMTGRWQLFESHYCQA